MQQYVMQGGAGRHPSVCACTHAIRLSQISGLPPAISYLCCTQTYTELPPTLPSGAAPLPSPRRTLLQVMTLACMESTAIRYCKPTLRDVT